MGKNVPKLRFRGFEGEWEEKRLGDIADKITEKNKNFRITNVISNSAKDGLINQRNFFDKDIANKNNIDGYYVIKKDSFVYNPRKSNEAPYGPINKFNHEEEGVVSPLYFCFNSKDNTNCDYLESYFKSSKWYRYIYMNSDQGARHDRVSIKDSEFMNMKILIASLQEQEKIANLLSKVDRYIELQEKKVSELEKYKKGMMQKIFSQKIRFRKDDGGEYPEWEEKRLGDVCTIYGRIGFRGYTVQDIVEKDKGVISLSPSNIVNSKLIINLDNTYISRFKYEESPEIKVFNGDILFVKTASIGRCALVKGLNEDATINPQLVVLKNIKISNKLLSEILLLPIIQQQVNKSKGGGVIPTLTQKEISSYKIFVPNSLEEQEKIAKFLSKVDLLIEKQSDRLEELKMWKKGLLQKMFV